MRNGSLKQFLALQKAYNDQRTTPMPDVTQRDRESAPEPCPLCGDPMVKDDDQWRHANSDNEACFLWFQHLDDEDDIAQWNDWRIARTADTARIAEMEGALRWYGEQAALARLCHSGGDAGRHALQEDGGKRATTALGGQP